MRIESQDGIVERKSHMGDLTLSEVVFSKEVKQLGDWAFSKCKNLTDVRFEGKYDSTLFSKGVFEGCNRLKSISFDGTDETTEYLLAAAVSRLKAPHLLRSDELGEKSWYDKWDLALRLFLNSDDEKMSAANALCGEEDISYDGIGSVDGEMPGESGDYIKDAAINKCILCYLRLIHNKNLDEQMSIFICDYLKEHSFGTKDAYAWITLKERCGDNLDFYKLYLDVLKPDREALRMMIDDLPDNALAAKAYLIQQCSMAGNSVLSGLFL